MKRVLLESNRALPQVLAGLVGQQGEQRLRQRWQGAVRQTTADSAAAVLTDLTEYTLTALDLAPGSWVALARAGVEISSTTGSPIYTGTEAFYVKLRAVRTEDQVALDDLDNDVISPATTQAASTGGFFSASTLLFASFSYDVPVTLQLRISADETDTANHIVPWRSGRIMALPF